MTIEQTLNRDSKTKGGEYHLRTNMLCEYLKCLLDTLYYIGVIGITLNRGALQHWILGQSERSAITRECMKMAGADPADR